MKPYIWIPITMAMVYRALQRGSLTPAGIAAAVLTAAAHAYHPWNTPFALLIVFFLIGTRATAVKKEAKARLTVASAGSSGGEGPRTHIQVLSNSLVGSVLAVLHALQLAERASRTGAGPQLDWPADPLFVGIVANYAAVAADTLASELGILSNDAPRLITSLSLRRVPPGTNGGVTPLGLGASALGAFVLALSAVLFSPLAGWGQLRCLQFVAAMTVWGTLGSLVDSLLGGWLQQSVRDVRSGKIVEGEGGKRVLVSSQEPEWIRPTCGATACLVHGEGVLAEKEADEAEERPERGQGDKTDGLRKYDAKNKNRRSSFGDRKPTRVRESGLDLLDNNGVNVLMALIMSVGAVTVAEWYGGIPVAGSWRPPVSV